MVAATVGEDAVTVDAAEPTRPQLPRRRASAPLVTGERYEVGELIGRGGMGEVRAAYDVQIGREVAIKRMHDPHPSPAHLSRFLREARIQGRLEHPAVPPVHELGADAEGRPYFVMKKLGGVTLAAVLKDPHRPRTREQLLRAFVEVCGAIELAHATGIVHRDLKPTNVLLGDLGEVYVLDWGIACELDAREAPGATVFGTPGYMAPEQLRGDWDLDGRADVYALGCILFEILTGQPLRPDRDPPPPRRDDVPPELDAAWRRATACERDDRIPTARALGHAVEQYLDGDRDLAHRRALASKHLELAQAALASSADEANRRATAMRAAGRALALDPALAGAAELMGHLMLTPPVETPPDVVREIAELDEIADRRHLRLISWIGIGYLLLVPVMWLLGMRDTTYVPAFVIGMAINVILQRAAMRSEKFKRAGWPLALVNGTVGMVLTARMFTPFLLTPAFIAVSMMSLSMSSMGRRLRTVVLSAGLSIAVMLGTYAAELVGLVSRTTWIEHGKLILRSPLDGAADFPTFPGLCFFVVSLLASSASVAHTLARTEHAARSRIQLQAWQLRQLL